MVIGGHGDTTMIPFNTFLASYNGVPVSNFLSQSRVRQKVAADTMVGGAYFQQVY